MFRHVILSAALVGFAAPALAETQTPATPVPAETATVVEATTTATPQATTLKRETSGYSGCNWGSKVSPTS